MRKKGFDQSIKEGRKRERLALKRWAKKQERTP